MTTENTFTAISIFLTAVNIAFIFYTSIQLRKKDFENKLFEIKLEAYRKLNQECYKAYKQLDINSTPFVQIYGFKKENEWVEYCKNNMGKMFHIGNDLKDKVYEYAFLLPTHVVDKFYDFSNGCISFVTMSYHFDTGLIINNQEQLWDFYTELLNEIRNDLKIDLIDGGLKNRLSRRELTD